jgi:hypothetical protein
MFLRLEAAPRAVKEATVGLGKTPDDLTLKQGPEEFSALLPVIVIIPIGGAYEVQSKSPGFYAFVRGRAHEFQFRLS